MRNLHLLVFALSFLASCQPPGERFEGALCIENITTIDAENGLKEKQTVILKDGKIEMVKPSGEIILDPDNEIIDGTGKYLIPGLWDAHMHFAFMEGLAPRMFDLYLGYGVTSLRDTGGKLAFVKKWKEEAEANPTEAPRVMIAGPLLDGMPNVYDGSAPTRPPLSVGLGTVEALKDQVNLLDSAGVDLLKAYEMLSPEQFTALMEIAVEKGLKVTGHVPLSMDVISASNAGLNSMEHMRNLELSCAANSAELLKQRRELLAAGKNDLGGILRSRLHDAQRENAIRNYDQNQADKVLRALSQNQTWQIPTLTLSTSFSERVFAEPEWQESFQYLPDSVALGWKAAIKNIAEQPVTPFQREYAEWLFNMVGQIHQAGIDIMAGTDAPIFFLTPGRSLHEELAVLVRAGLSPIEALKAATLNPARYFDLEEELGLIQAGMWADLVILTANPLEDIENTQRIDAVVRQGKYYNRNALDHMLQGAPPE